MKVKNYEYITDLNLLVKNEDEISSKGDNYYFPVFDDFHTSWKKLINEKKITFKILCAMSNIEHDEVDFRRPIFKRKIG